MQSTLYRRALPRLPRASTSTRVRLTTTPKRNYAAPAEEFTNRWPLMVAGALVFSVPVYYIMHSDKPSASEQAAIKEKRRKHGTEDEHRDPRDSPVKTLEQKRARDGQ
ncbi:hypothetical protein LTR84_004598 [Exophiala bonariae]|uniref:Uncharacterized protein n=1 Tax=Exophiala bonariae TaxID=1690606 RepID=A0AAV9NR42_9EURO|nr:hypothetical protein LTR84_004598 [Exophiala bonariae]